MLNPKLLPTEVVFPHARISSGGVLTFPKRGDPPKVIQGYRVDSNDKYVFHPLIKPCKYRDTMWRKICGGLVQNIHCKKFGIDVKCIDCLDCQDREE